MKDPYIPGRIIMLSYQEDKKVSPILLRDSPSAATIAKLFDPGKKQSFETIASSFTITPTDTHRMATGVLPMLGVAFQYPAYWGALEYSDPTPGKPGAVLTPNVSFQSALFSGDAGTPTVLQFDIENSSTVGSFSEGIRPPLFHYAGQVLGSVCEQHGYVNTTAYDFVLSRCFVKATESSANIALVTGTYASTSVAAILFPTTSKLWPGMTISVESKDSSVFNQDEMILSRMADSLSYFQ